jgi:hypothetical protein
MGDDAGKAQADAAPGNQAQNRIGRCVVPRKRLADARGSACDDDFYFFFLTMSTR